MISSEIEQYRARFGDIERRFKKQTKFVKEIEWGNRNGYTDQTEIQTDTKVWILIVLHVVHLLI